MYCTSTLYYATYTVHPGSTDSGYNDISSLLRFDPMESIMPIPSVKLSG